MRILCVALAVALAGCQTTSNNSADFSVPADYRRIVAEHYRKVLKDPYSVRDAGITAPRREFVGVLNGGVQDAVCVRMNAKNSFGGYVGIRREVIAFRGGAVRYADTNDFACLGEVPFLPFPELEKPAPL